MKRKTREEIEKRLEELETANKKLKYQVESLWIVLASLIGFILLLIIG